MAIEYVGSQSGGRGGELGTENQTYALTGGLGDPQPNEGDLVVIALCTGSAGRTPSCAIPGPNIWTPLGLLTIGSAPYDVCLDVSYRILGANPSTYFTVPASGNLNDSQCWTVHAYRGVDPTTPLDVAPVSALGTGTTRGNPPPILPVTTGAAVFVTAGGASGTGTTLTQAGGLAGFRQVTYLPDVNDSVLGSGHVLNWMAGVIDIGAYTTGSNNVDDSWASYVIALRPAQAVIVGLSVMVLSGRGARVPIMPSVGAVSRFLAETLHLSDTVTAVTGALTRQLAETLHITQTITAIRSGTETITWDPVFGASDYRIEVGSTPGASDVLVTHTGNDTPSYTLSLPPGTYYVRVYSVGADGGDWQTNYGPASDEMVIVI